MIGKVMRKRRDGLSSFRALVEYVAFGIKGGKVIEKVESAGCTNLLGLNTAIAEMKACAVQNVRCKDAALHFMLSWREGEVPTLSQVQEAIQHALKRLGLDECQSVWGLHNDTDCLHAHIAVNRVHPETYRAVDPAHGWTKNELERACREIELMQGWPIEQTGKFTVANNEVVWKTEAKARAARRERSVNQAARDFETRTGEKSAERIAIEDAAPIILAATSWEEMHLQLGAIGVRYLRKGSGVVLQVGDEFVKASSAHRDAAIARVVKRLGEFQPSADNCVITIRTPVPVSPMPEGWANYATVRQKRRRAKQSAQKTLHMSLREQYQQLQADQRSERKTFYAQGWQGRGQTMRAERSLLAARHAAQVSDLRDSQRKARFTSRQQWQRLPTFREVLEELNRQPALGYAVREELRYSGRIASMHGPNVAATLVDIRGFVGRIQGRFVTYSTNLNAGSPAFTDHGKKIHVHENQDASAILAALQLAAQKWNGKVTLGGPDSYKRTAIRLAITEGISITNPDLQPLIDQERAYLEGIRLTYPPRAVHEEPAHRGTAHDPAPGE